MRLEGEQLGHYRLTRFIQGGGMGEVYLAEDLTLSRQVAIKVMKTEPVLYPDAQASKDAARLFQREMRAISMLDHAHILTLHEAGEQRVRQENITYMVMPYCPEGSLADWIRRYHSKQPLSPDKVAQVLQQAADALQYAHDQKILHLDVKPSNFLARRQHNPSQLPNLLLDDFGVAKIATTSKLSATPRGTFEYMAPEQLAGTPVAASDQYALGIMIYELLTGRTPFQGALPQVIFYQHANVDPESPSSVNPSLPSVLDTVVLRALAKKPQNRFVSVKEFASAFATALKPSAAQHVQVNKVLNRIATPDTKRPSPVKHRSPKSGYLWALVIGVVAGVLTIGASSTFDRLYGYGSFYENASLIVTLLILWTTGLAVGKITGQRRTGWIPGIILPIITLLARLAHTYTGVLTIGSYYVNFPAMLVFRLFPSMNEWSSIIIYLLTQGTICGIISFWGASFVTRKRRK